MSKVTALGAALALLTLAMVGTAMGTPDHETGPLEPHPHALLLGLELDEDGNPISARKCVDLAANQAVPLDAHHVHVHVGPAGEALFSKAGNVVIPMAPFPAPFAEPVPWSDCESLLASAGM